MRLGTIDSTKRKKKNVQATEKTLGANGIEERLGSFSPFVHLITCLHLFPLLKIRLIAAGRLTIEHLRTSFTLLIDSLGHRGLVHFPTICF
ncbi:hypothetical protein PM082_014833 [Marasmius tenuissimus]|nr:hypothetical protein PM082_014833 [Marasmius tenuissimus]